MKNYSIYNFSFYFNSIAYKQFSLQLNNNYIFLFLTITFSLMYSFTYYCKIVIIYLINVGGIKL